MRIIKRKPVPRPTFEDLDYNVNSFDRINDRNEDLYMKLQKNHKTRLTQAEQWRLTEYLMEIRIESEMLKTNVRRLKALEEVEDKSLRGKLIKLLKR